MLMLDVAWAVPPIVFRFSDRRSVGLTMFWLM